LAVALETYANCSQADGALGLGPTEKGLSGQKTLMYLFIAYREAVTDVCLMLKRKSSRTCLLKFEI
jgi:hypothetical protein